MSMIIGKFYKGVEETKFRFGVKIAKFTGFSGNGWLMFESKNGRYKLCNNGGNYQEATIEEEYEQGKEDGEREMFKKFQCNCRFIREWHDDKQCFYNCTSDKECNFETCPIAKGGK